MSIREKKQMSFKFNGTGDTQDEMPTQADTVINERSCVIRSITHKLDEKKRVENKEVTRGVLSRINHLL